MIKNDLVCENDGSKTYKNSKTGKEDVLDYTLISTEAKRFISRWKIHKDLSLSTDWSKKMIEWSDHYIMESLFDFRPVVYDIPDRLTWNFDETKIKDF